jgi:hypothetical protein
MAHAIDIAGKVFGRWTAIKFVHKIGRFHYWLFMCSCGTEKVIYKGHVGSGKGLSGSCGCLLKELMTTHGMSKTGIYGVWSTMLNRCRNPKVKSFPEYGGRGITVCERWESFENFFADMGERPFVGAEIDRVDNDHGYSPDNCVWTTKTKNLANTRQNVIIEAFGKSMTESAWAKETGLDRTVISYRIRKGWTPEDALTKPARPINRIK